MAIKYSGNVRRGPVASADGLMELLYDCGYEYIAPLYASGFGLIATWWQPGDNLVVGTGGSWGFCYEPPDWLRCIDPLPPGCPFLVECSLYPCTPYVINLQPFYHPSSSGFECKCEFKGNLALATTMAIVGENSPADCLYKAGWWGYVLRDNLGRKGFQVISRYAGSWGNRGTWDMTPTISGIGRFEPQPCGGGWVLKSPATWDGTRFFIKFWEERRGYLKITVMSAESGIKAPDLELDLSRSHFCQASASYIHIRSDDGTNVYIGSPALGPIAWENNLSSMLFMVRDGYGGSWVNGLGFPYAQTTVMSENIGWSGGGSGSPRFVVPYAPGIPEGECLTNSEGNPLIQDAMIAMSLYGPNGNPTVIGPLYDSFILSSPATIGSYMTYDSRLFECIASQSSGSTKGSWWMFTGTYYGEGGGVVEPPWHP